MRAYNLLICAILASTSFTFVDGAKILAIAVLPFKSHWMSMSPLLEELTKRGHEVTAISRFPSENPLPGYKVFQVLPDIQRYRIVSSSRVMEFLLDNFNEIAMNILNFNYFFTILKDTEPLLQTDVVQSLINSNDQHFDLIIHDILQEPFLAFTHKFQAHSILISPLSGGILVNEAVGNPYNPSYVPSPYYKYSDRMSFIERLINTLCEASIKFLFRTFYYSYQNSLMKKYFTNLTDLPDLLDLYHRESAIFLHSHESVRYSRPLLPNGINIGGIHIGKVRPLYKELHDFIENATEGMVYVALGSFQTTERFSPNKINILLRAFSKLKYSVLFKLNGNSSFKIPNNVMTADWLPQNDILAHRNTKVFISHGGAMSVMESVYHGVPVVGIPVEGDGRGVVTHVETSGYGLKIEYPNITESSIVWAVNEVMNNPRYRENAMQRSIIFKDRPQTPLETAVYWTEYIIKHKGAPHLRSSALDLSWYQYYLLDVFSVLAAITAVAVFSLIKLTKLLIRKLLRRDIAYLIKKAI